MANSKKRIQSYFSNEAEGLLAKFDSVEKLIPSLETKGSSHSAEEGRYIESILRDFLNNHLPKSLIALSGFILRVATKTGENDKSRLLTEEDQHSKQLDIIVYDINKYPVYLRFEEFAIVPPEGVIGVISVKKTLRKNHIKAELESLKDVINLCRHGKTKRLPFTCIFSFKAEKSLMNDSSKLFQPIRESYIDSYYDEFINEITIINAYLLMKRFKYASGSDGKTSYVEVSLKNNNHIAIQRLLQSILGVYYTNSHNTEIKRPGFIKFEKDTFSNKPILEIPYADKN